MDIKIYDYHLKIPRLQLDYNECWVDHALKKPSAYEIQFENTFLLFVIHFLKNFHHEQWRSV